MRFGNWFNIKKIFMKQIRFATTNEYKIKFANNLLKNYDWECVPYEVSLIEPQSMSQEEISRYKVRQAYEQAREPIITMDSGIFINALNGFPGIYTSDIFKTLTNEQILRLLDGAIDRSAFIRQALSYADEKQLKTFTSKSEGTIVLPEEVVEGYAFDAFFKSNEIDKVMGVMSEEEKNQLWGEAWNQLGRFLSE